MPDLDFDAFSKKYSFAIDGLKMRLSNENKRLVAEKLYNDSMRKTINMNDLNRSLELFYQGNVFGQVELNKYVKKYNI